MATKKYTPEDRLAIMTEVEEERKAVEQEILADLNAISDKINAAIAANLYIGGLSMQLQNVRMNIDNYRMIVKEPTA